MVSLQVSADVCRHCGESLCAEDVVRLFQKMQNKLRKQEFSQFKSLGQSFTVADDWPNKAIQSTT